MTKAEQAREERNKQAAQRAADKKSRLQESNRRQRAADTETYGEGSMLLEAQEGNIYDVETGEYDPDFNKQGTDETISNDGIDQFGIDEGSISGGGGDSDVDLNNDWYSYDGSTLVFGADPAESSIESLQITYSGLALKCKNAGGGFNIQDSSGNAKINVFMQDVPTATSSNPAKFREVKVCHNGQAATMYVLGTKPESS